MGQGPTNQIRFWSWFSKSYQDYYLKVFSPNHNMLKLRLKFFGPQDPTNQIRFLSWFSKSYKDIVPQEFSHPAVAVYCTPPPVD
jgi:hypothetical protein